MKKSLFSFLVLSLILVLSVSVFAVTYTDIERWKNEKVLNGYEDNTFRPDNLLTRAEYVAIISRMFEPKNVADLSKYTDLDKNAWYYDSFSKVFTMNAIQGTSSTTMNPNANITRQEAMVILNRILDLKISGETDLKYTDAKEVATWATKAVLAFTSNGYVNGYEDGSVRPTNNITRAECARILDAAIGRIIRTSGEYDLTGVRGSIIVLAENVTLKNADLDKVFVSNEDVRKTLKFDNTDKNDNSDVVVIDPDTKKSSSSGGGGGGSSTKKEDTLIVTFKKNASGDMYDITKEGTVKDGVKATLIFDGEKIIDGEIFSSSTFSALKEKVAKYIKDNAKARKDDCEALVKTAYEKYYKTDKKDAAIALINELAEACNITPAERAKIREMRDEYIAGTKTGKQLYKENIETYRSRVIDAYTELTYEMAKKGLEIL